MRVYPLALRSSALTVALLAFASAEASAQNSYLLPPEPIPSIVTAQPTPTVSVGPDRQTLAVFTRAALPPIAEIAEPELRLAGVRISPRTNGPAPSRAPYSDGLSFQNLASGAVTAVRLPPDARILFTQWSPNGRHLAFVNALADGLELWVADVTGGAARRVLGGLNGTLTMPFRWLPDNSGFLVSQVLPDRGAPPAISNVPTGPIIQENAGREAPARTYQDLLQNPGDEALFDYYFASRIVRVPLAGGAPTELAGRGIYYGFSPSPNGEFVMLTRVKRPYSYALPVWSFPEETSIVDNRGNVVKVVVQQPLLDNLPIAFDAVPTGARNAEWRADAPATVVWVEAQDGGDPRLEAPVRDRIMMLPAPFTGSPTRLVDLDQRFAGIRWGRDDFAMVTSRWWNTRWERRIAVSPADPSRPARVLSDRSQQDRYSDPGTPVMTMTATGNAVMLFDSAGTSVFLTSVGASERGNYPFLDAMDVASGATRRIWRAEDPYFETVVAVVDRNGSRILTRRESIVDAPNFVVRNIPSAEARVVTTFPDPAPQFANLRRQLVTYQRNDGVRLSGTLYLPPGHDLQRDGPLPLLMWAYPTEFRDAAAAAQISDSPNRFVRPGGSSHLFLLLAGYAILDNPSMPIIGEGDAEPNDTYIQQLVASAQAAVDRMVEMGVTTRDRVAIGGHSYGAFMTANLLAHSDIFRAGIARSGAYNRTLTPFGFQAEQRSFWQATDTYMQMSPFTFAHKVNEPILLIHGENDSNSGTFPIQSERFYAALRGHGATVRYVVLPLEDHGYRARESVLHTLAEMISWLDRHVKAGTPPRAE